ncbi:hypothetical protein GCM10010404_76210 [Nonomuraea africana]
MPGCGSVAGGALGSALPEGCSGFTVCSDRGCREGTADRVLLGLAVGVTLVRVGVAVGVAGGVVAGVGRLDRLALGVAVDSERSGEAAMSGRSPVPPGQPLTVSVVPESRLPITKASSMRATVLKAMEPTMTSRRPRPLWSTKTDSGVGAGPLSGDTASDRSDG